MPDVVTLVGDLSRLAAELDSLNAQKAKQEEKGEKDKAAEIDKTIAQSQEHYDAIADQLPPELVAEVQGELDKLREAQAALAAVNARIEAAYPPPVDISVAQASVGANDATVSIEEG